MKQKHSKIRMCKFKTTSIWSFGFSSHEVMGNVYKILKAYILMKKMQQQSMIYT
ncbi:hypothetical protein [uncultured Eubacterium sp.]|uniref:hypothetical protein n=1 Tax=uncultured Eubacterium sp. TaxID=165185 RepID=UPI003267E102